RLDGFLVTHAEAMLLVDDDEADVAKILRVLQQAMRPYDHIHIARAKSLDDTLRIFARTESGQDFHAHRPVGETVLERLAVLLREQGRRPQDRYLLAAVHWREGCAQRDFRFAEANVAANDAVHGAAGLEVRKNLVDRAALVLRRLERKAVLECAIFR